MKEKLVSVLDVAAYIIDKLQQVSAVKLQKLVYYSQAWSLVWDDQSLFEEPIEAWAHGPVVPELFAVHKGQFLVESIEGGESSLLSTTQRETVDGVLQYYGDKSSQWLSDLTHLEDPWRNARVGIPTGARCDTTISLESIAEYYSSIPPNA